MRKKEIFVWLLLLGPMVLLGGCVIAAVGAGAGTVAYVRGDLEAAEPKELGDVYKATVKAVEELELNVIEKNKDAMTATFIMRDAEDKKIRIKLNSTAEGTTKISIRVGWFGDETKSRFIYEKIQDKL